LGHCENHKGDEKEDQSDGDQRGNVEIAEGFREFSNLRGVFVRGEGDMIDVLSPPYGPTAEAVVNAAFQGATPR